jgi:dTDP-4-amino-4,6-dideoxygalactose transaminase
VDKNNSIGKIGDYVIYSFPKIFPVQFGGLLVSGNKKINQEKSVISAELKKNLKNTISNYIINKEKIIEKRIRNYNFLKNQFAKLNITPRFSLTKGCVPGVFMFCIEDKNTNLQNLKTYFYSHGIQCSVFYGEHAFFIPCHQNLKTNDLIYFVEVYKSFKNTSK